LLPVDYTQDGELAEEMPIAILQDSADILNANH
jgi:hypothetical protein